MKKLIIFGDRDFAQIASAYFAYDDKVDVCAFTVHKKFLHNPRFCGKTVYAFEDIEIKFPVYEYYFFAPIADSKLREQVYIEAKKKGYRFHSYISRKCTNFSKEIGENCFIQEDNTIQLFSKIGNNVVLWAGNHVGHHSVIEDCVTVTSHVVISGHCKIKKHAYLGVNSTIRDGVTVEEESIVGLGAGVTKDTQFGKTYIGLPAKCL